MYLHTRRKYTSCKWPDSNVIFNLIGNCAYCMNYCTLLYMPTVRISAAVMFFEQIGLTVFLPFNFRRNKLFNIPFHAPAAISFIILYAPPYSYYSVS